MISVALTDILHVLQKTLPATLRIKDVDLIRLGLSLIAFYTSSYQSEIRYSDIVVSPKIVIPDVLQYQYLQFVYEDVSRRFIRIADKNENYDPIYAVLCQIYCPTTFYNIRLTDEFNEELCYIRECKGAAELVIRPAINSKVIKFEYRTDTGLYITGSKNVTILKASSYLPILQFNRVLQSWQESPFMRDHKLFETCIPDLISQYIGQCRICDAKVSMFRWDKVPACYQSFYIPTDCQEFYINDGIRTKKHKVNEVFNGTIDLEDFSIDRTDLNVID